MKKLSYILLFFISFQGFAQNYADKKFYLVDSLILEELSKQDKQLIDSCLNVYHQAKDDTSKINTIEFLVEGCLDSKVWPKYNQWVYDFVNRKLSTNPSSIIKRRLQTALAGAINNIGFMYNSQGDHLTALSYFNKSLKMSEEIGDKHDIASSLLNIGFTYYNQGDVSKALNYYHKGLKIQEEVGNKKDIANSLNNIGYTYSNQGDFPNALNYYLKGLKIQEEIGDKAGVATSLNNIGFIYNNQGNLPIALSYFNKSLRIREEIGDKKGIAQSFNNIGSIYNNQENLATALSYYDKGLKIREEIGDKQGIAYSSNSIGSIQLKQGNLVLAKEYGLRSLGLAQEIGFPENIARAATLLSDVYKKQGKGLEALEMYILAATMRDSINNEETQKAAIKQHAKYEYENAQAIKDKEHEKQLVVEKEAKAKQKIIIYAIASGLGLVVLFLIFVFNRLQVTKKQKTVIEAQKTIVEKAHHQLEEKNQEIMDSITYAKRIQSAILPPKKIVKEYLQESFILYKPKDIVAGDFYWLETASSFRHSLLDTESKGEIAGQARKDVILFAAADCTGHGVPGAMVSVVCVNGLNRSVREYGLTDPGKILDKTREIVISEFEKSEEDVKDGMDVSLCVLDDKKLSWAGANNPLWIIRQGAVEIEEIKADKQPIGKYAETKPFTTHQIQLNKGDSIYIFTDGYHDQFGGEKGKKFKAAKLRELLLSIQKEPMEKQREIIDQTFELWKGNLEQVDDVCVMGVRI